MQCCSTSHADVPLLLDALLMYECDSFHWPCHLVVMPLMLLPVPLALCAAGCAPQCVQPQL